MTDISVEPTGSTDTGICDCCGRSSRRVWGEAHADGRTLAAYFVHWTLGHVRDRGANIDLIIGEWGEAATSERRKGIALAYRLLENGPSIMVIDAVTRPFSSSPLIGKSLGRAEVVGTSDARDAFAVVDAVLAQDERVAELLGR